jgi:hypothetical protein
MVLLTGFMNVLVYFLLEKTKNFLKKTCDYQLFREIVELIYSQITYR